MISPVPADSPLQLGCIDNFYNNPEELIDFVATEAEARGLFEDSVRLHDLAKVSCDIVGWLEMDPAGQHFFFGLHCRTTPRFWSCCVD